MKQYFNEGKKNEVKAVDDISFQIYRGETLGLVGSLVVENPQLDEHLLNYMMQRMEKLYLIMLIFKTSKNVKIY